MLFSVRIAIKLMQLTLKVQNPKIRLMSDESSKLPPSSSDLKRAEKYIDELTRLIEEDKIKVFHTDLSKFDPTSLQDHYWVDLKHYQVEISHSKKFQSGEDSYVMIFNNLKHLGEGQAEKVILAYINLEANHFIKFKSVADDQITINSRKEEEKRFNQAVEPINQALEQLGASFEKTPASTQESNHSGADTPNNQSGSSLHRKSISDYSESPLGNNTSYLKSQFGPN